MDRAADTLGNLDVSAADRQARHQQGDALQVDPEFLGSGVSRRSQRACRTLHEFHGTCARGCHLHQLFIRHCAPAIVR